MAEWYSDYVQNPPRIVSPELPGPRSREIHGRAEKYMKGFSSQVQLFPVVFEEGRGPFLRDADGNTYIDFSSGIYVTGCGHAHPKIAEALKRMADRLWNAHDFTASVKVEALELLVDVLPGDISGVQFYSDGTPAVEAGLRAARAITGRFEFLSFWKDFHGKTLGSVSLAGMSPDKGIRSPGFFLAPRPNCYRCPFKMEHPACNLYCVDFTEKVLREETTGRVAAVVMEPIQGWAGSVFPPEAFIPELKKRLEKLGILLFLDEILTGMGRTGDWFACDHYGVVPDIITLGKGLGNGFPVTVMAVREPYKEHLEKISASSSFGGNPLACAAALATLKVIKEEKLLENARKIEAVIMKRLEAMKQKYRIVGDVRGRGCLFGVELVKDKQSKEPFEAAGKLVYQKAFRKGLAWIPAGHILRMSPPLVINEELALKGVGMIEEAIAETERELL
ncbi:MAG TPA: aspartate aminotransferase family protein [bacterium]|uniref:2,2-dialkylglycine decarboxylase n=1 Tax=candidate division TA06 bacterium ADurb.Bin417 TaxID=1852828 RepID=A0A1V5MBV1_UNCT6|nr:MAG: 2,2-dialkylglycine decarboxylase [candidate division TA06 bacterium ADurb.Bin417]HNQ34466.1 aspartate aminotransferase family protein [bacterium]HNS48125.1 aspartate aminotransferase family protein [bacterium]